MNSRASAQGTSFGGGSFLGTGSGSSSFLGGTSGSNTRTGTSGRGSSTGGVSNTNPFGQYYANPLASGFPGGTTGGRNSGSFGQTLYAVTTTGTAGGLGGARTGGFGGTGPGGGGFGGGGQASTGLGSSSSSTTRRTPTYTVAIAFDYRPIVGGRVLTDVQQTLARSSMLTPNTQIQVILVGSNVVLRGKVATNRDRTLAESLVRFTPGVRDVRNELRTADVLPPPKPVSPATP